MFIYFILGQQCLQDFTNGLTTCLKIRVDKEENRYTYETNIYFFSTFTSINLGIFVISYFTNNVDAR